MNESVTQETSPTGPNALTTLTALSDADRRVALERFHLLQPYLEQGVSLTRVTREAGVSYRTALRWVALYRRFGLASLARKGRTDKGGRRVLSPQMQKAVEGLALQTPPLPIATLYRQIYKLAAEQGEKPPSYSVIYDVVGKLPDDLVTLAHEGTKAYSDSYELVHRREAERPNAIWQADHTLMDILLLRSDGDENDQKDTKNTKASKVCKPWLTVVIDDYSRAIAGYFLSFDAPSAIQTALALRQAIWRKEDGRWQVCGIPEVLYTDNGSDFTSQHLEQVAADLKMRLVFSIPGRPRGRGRIERFFSSLNQMCLSGLPGQTSPGVGICGQTNQPKLTLPEFDVLIREFILSTYHGRVHSETKMAPLERWEKGGFLPQMPASLEQLDLLLLTIAKSRKVHPDGIRFQGFRYVDTTLAAYINESVTLRYDPRDLAEVRLFHEGRFLCRAICPELAGETVPLREVLRARSQRRRELRATIRDRKKVVEALLDLKRGHQEEKETQEETEETTARKTPSTSSLKRYLNE